MATRNLLSGPVTLSAVTAKSRNVLHALEYPQQKEDFYKHMETHRPLLADLVAHHLGTKPADVTISSQDYWRHGSFNLCIPVHVNPSTKSNPPQLVLLCFPLPYRVGEVLQPGNSDKKVNYEAVIYAWLQENCPSVPIPQLYGFGLSTNQRSRWFQQARRYFLATFGVRQPSRYVCYPSSRFADLDIGYLLIQTIISGEILSESWDEKHDDARL
ncbi:Aminoglycoside phosphotransferase [Metarhizium brunneum]